MASNVIIEETSDAEDILCATMAANHAEVNDGYVFIHAQHMQITKSDIIDALLMLNDALSQTWIVDLGASFHVAPIKECLTTSNASSLPHVYIGNNHSCSVEGIGIVHLILDGTNDLFCIMLGMYQASRKAYCLLDKWICMDIVPSLRKCHGRLSKALG